MKEKNKVISFYCFVYLFVFLLINFIYFFNGFAPYGDISLAYDDGYWQYMDFFSYYKQVLEGKQSIFFSLSTGLGMPNIAMFSYYLSSPWNLLVYFYDIENLHAFFDTIIALKLACAAVTFSYFINIRLSYKLNKCFVLILAVSYALMQYNVSQATCTMWLDGVYMLPLLLLGVYKLVNNNKPTLLCSSVALAILFNWYSAGIDCLFSIIWFIYELAISNVFASKKEYLKVMIKYLFAMLIGIGISAPIFFPTVYTTLQATRGTADLSIFRNEFLGNIINVICGYTIGATSSRGMVATFCGSVVLIGVIMYFTSVSASKKEKYSILLVIAIVLLGCYYQPFFAIFSLFQNAESYYYRFSYLICFTLIYIAACFYSSISISTINDKKENSLFLNAIKYIICWEILVFLINYLKGFTEDKNLYLSAMYVFIIAVCFSAYISNDKQIVKRIFVILFCCFSVLEIIQNASILMKKYSSNDVEAFKNYQYQQNELISRIKQYDEDYYRITQTSARAMSLNSLANMNEAMGFGYWDIGSYVSSPPANQISFLEKIGYKVYGQRLVEKAMVLLPADSLMGVKYVLSSYDYKDLKLINDLGEGNKKSVYLNEYCMPLAYKISADDSFSFEASNEYEYQNALFDYLFNTHKNIFEPAEYTIEENDGSRKYCFDIRNGRYAIYGNIPYSYEAGASLDLNGKVSIDYAIIHSLNNFYVPVDDESKFAYVQLYSSDLTAFGQPTFYFLDLNELEECAKIANDNAASIIKMTDTDMRFVVQGHSGESLFISVPYDIGWDIKINGLKVEPYTVEKMFMVIPLYEGNNDITIKYHLPFEGNNILICLLAVAILYLWDRKKLFVFKTKHFIK